jgi:hypothetical protein
MDRRELTWAKVDVPDISDIKVQAGFVERGQTMRYTSGDRHWDYRVTDVSDADEDGDVTVSVEPLTA